MLEDGPLERRGVVLRKRVGEERFQETPALSGGHGRWVHQPHLAHRPPRLIECGAPVRVGIRV